MHYYLLLFLAIHMFQADIRSLSDLGIKLKGLGVEHNQGELQSALDKLIEDKVIKYGLSTFEIVDQNKFNKHAFNFNKHIKKAMAIKLLEIGE